MELFLRNLLLGEHNVLKNRYTRIRWETVKQDIESRKQDIGDGKQDIGDRKQDIEDEKQDFEIPDNLRKRTQEHVRKLFDAFGYDVFFGRAEVMDLLGITASPASELLRKMRDAGLVYPMKGKGKGKYLFRRG